MNPTKLCKHIPTGDACFGHNAGFSPDLPRSYQGHPDLTDAQGMNCVMMAIPPGLVSGCSGDYSSFICVQPEAINRVRVKMGLIFYGPDWAQKGCRLRRRSVPPIHGRGQESADRHDARAAL